MILSGCKEKWKHDGKLVRPTNSLALWETERVLVERLRLQLQVMRIMDQSFRHHGLREEF